MELTPSSSQHAKARFRGVRMTVTDRDAHRAVTLGVELATALRDLHPGEWTRERFADLLASPAAIARLERGEPAATIVSGWAAEQMEFERRRARYLMYE